MLWTYATERVHAALGNIASDSNDTTRAAWEGVNEGLADCTD